MKRNYISKLAMVVAIACFGTLTVACGGDDDNKGDDAPKYLNFEGHSYQIVKQNKSWTDAAADAVSLGGYLAEIGSKAEQDAIYNFIKQSSISPTYLEVPDGGGVGYIWIGANDISIEGGWIWNGANKSGVIPLFWLGNYTGQAVAKAYNNWGGTAAGKLNEPDNFTETSISPKGQNTAAIGLAKWPAGGSTEQGKAGEWNDIAQTNKIYYLVEFDSMK